MVLRAMIVPPIAPWIGILNHLYLGEIRSYGTVLVHAEVSPDSKPSAKTGTEVKTAGR